MANLQVTVPDATLPEFTNIGKKWMDAKVPPIDYSALTNAQIIRLWMVGILKEAYVTLKERQAETTREVTYRAGVAVDKTAAETDASGIN